MQTDCLPLQVENRKRKIKEIKLLTKYLNAMKKIYFLFLFALIASMSGLQAAEKWTLVTSEPESWEGDYLIVNTTSKVAFDGSGVEKSGLDKAGNYVSVDIANNQIETTDCDFYFTIAQKDGGYSIKSASGYYIYRTEDKNGMDVSAEDNGVNTISLSGQNAVITSSGINLQWFNQKNSERFRYYNSEQQIIQLYKKAAPATELTAPVITGVVNGETYYGSATVSISYPELATSMIYTITKDGTVGEPVTVTSAVENLVIDEAGSYKIEATAFGDGDAMEGATPVEFTVVGNTEVSSVMDFLGQAAISENPDEIYEFTCPLTVTYQYDGDIYVRDADGGALLIYDKNRTYRGKYSMGDVIPAGATGKYDDYEGAYELIEATLGDATKKVEVEPVEMAVDAIATTDQSKYVVLKGVTIGDEVFVDAESNEIAFYNSFNVEIPAEVANAYDVTGIVELHKGNVQIAPIAFEVAKVNKCVNPVFSLAEGTYNETQTLTITSTEGSTIIYSINDGEIEEAASPATITLEAEASAVTYEIVAFATMDGAEDSETVTKTYTIDPTAQIEDMDFATIVSEGGHKYGNGTSCYEFISGDVTVTSTKGSVDSRFWENKDVFTYRFYGGATLTVSVPAKYALTKIEFVADEGLTSMTTETGNYSAESGAKAVWTATDEVSSVTFSTTKTVILEDMIVYYKAIPAGVEGVEAADAAIRTNADGVVVTADGAVAEVYNAAGQLVAAEAVDGERVIALPAGFYIVRVGDATAKVVVK